MSWSTHGETLVDSALTKLGVVIEPCNVVAFQEVVQNDSDAVPRRMTSKIRIQRSEWGSDDDTVLINEEELPWDAVLWTAGSLPASPISTNGCDALPKSNSGRIATDTSLRCLPLVENNKDDTMQPKLWALGDCAEIVKSTTSAESNIMLPKTAQVAMQQADTVAANVLSQLMYDEGVASTVRDRKQFVYQDLGSMLTLGGPNAAVLAPKEDTTYGPIFSPLLDVAGVALGITDSVLTSFGRTSIAEQLGLPTPEVLGLSFSSSGLGITDPPRGTLAGTLAGAARRTVYAVRMPTNQQRAVSLISATISTAAALIKENNDRNKKP
jgi:Pyridine nucleotide-disulphide oxidoreductase